LFDDLRMISMTGCNTQDFLMIWWNPVARS